MPKAPALALALTAFGALGALTPLPAHAEDQPLWELGLGVGVLQLPHYRGADQSHTWWLPVPYVVYRGDWLKADREGARARLLAGDRHELSLSFNASPPTRSEDNRAREGMPDLAPTGEVGPVWKTTLHRGDRRRVDVRLPLRAVFTLEADPRHVGWASTPSVNLDQGVGDWQLGAQTGPVFGDRRLHQHYYGVPAEFATAGRPAHAARAGYAGWQSTLAVSRQVGGLWLGLYARHDALGGSVIDGSPLVREHSQWSGGLAVSWVFARSATLVPAPR